MNNVLNIRIYTDILYFNNWFDRYKNGFGYS